MAEGGFDDFEMDDLGSKYPEYDDLNEQELYDEYDSLTQNRLKLLRSDTDPQDEQFVHVKERVNYIERIEENKFGTSNKDGKTVIGSTSGIIAPEFELESPKNEKVFAVEDFIKRNYSKSFSLDTLHNDEAIEYKKLIKQIIT